MEEIDFFIKVVRCTIIVIDVLSLIGNSINLYINIEIRHTNIIIIIVKKLCIIIQYFPISKIL